MKKLVAAAAAVALAAGLTVAVTAGSSGAREAASSPTSSAARASYTPPPITWGPCNDATLDHYLAKCGNLVVPLDYAKPRGKKIKLAVSRVLHTTSDADYQGVMLVNPGGPGGSGLILSVYQTFVPNGAGAAYDWIGFDPRGVGKSTPAPACDASIARGDRPPYRPTSSAIMKRWVTISKNYAADCKQAPGSKIFQHAKTRDSVRDMESLRKALGQRQINFYGFSYGTYLGSVYATQHPNRVRRFVFDGTVNPDRVFYRSNLDQDVAFQTSFNKYFSYLAKNKSVFHVGGTRKVVRHRYLAAIRRLDRKAAGGVLGGDELTDVFTSAGYYVYDWNEIGDAWSTYLNKGDASGLIARYQNSVDLTPGGDNGYAMYLATQCTDARWPQSQARLNRDSRRLDKKYDYLTWANAWFNGPCAYWKYAASKPVKVTGARVRTPILMIGETYDAATPFSGSLRVRQLFPSASLIEGKNGTTHAGSLSGVACTDDAIAAYLADGTVPKRLAGRRSDKICSPVPAPEATAPGASSSQQRGGNSTDARTLQLLRDTLEAAQRPGV